jgi:hypothetical protein
VARRARRAEQRADDPVPVAYDRIHQLLVGGGVGPERGARLSNRALEYRRRPVVEGVGERGGRVDPLEAVLLERERLEEGRGVPERMYGGAEIVDEARQRHLRGAGAATDRFFGLQDRDRATTSGQLYRGGEAVRPRPHDYGVVRAAFGHALRRRIRPRILRPSPANV